MSLIPLPWRILALLVLAAALLGFGWLKGAEHGEARLDAYRAAQDRATLAAVTAAAAKTHELQLRKDEALHAASLRAISNAQAAAAARSERDGLRDQLAAAQRRLPDAPRAAADQYTTALGELLDQCAAGYAGLAEKADGHANDVRTLMEGWPK